MNNMYAPARTRLLQAGLNWSTIGAKLIAWSGAYTFDETNTVVADLPSGLVQLGISQAITGKAANPLGYAQSDPVLLQGLSPGDVVSFFTLVEDNGGVQTSWPLLAFMDTGIDFPMDPNGSDYLIQPDWLQGRGWFRA